MENSSLIDPSCFTSTSAPVCVFLSMPAYDCDLMCVYVSACDREKGANSVPMVVHLFSPSMPSTAVKTNTNRRRKVKNKSE